MTNQKTISSLVSFYATKLQNQKNINLTSRIGLSYFAAHFLSSCGAEECFRYIKSDIQAIVCDVLDIDKTYLYMYGNRELDISAIAQIDEKMIRYRAGEPLAYLLGYKYFWDQKLKVTQDTLIPRADTEVLVQAVLDSILRENAELRILDLGTGTGAIALALAGELTNAQVAAVDCSAKALEVAKENAISNDIRNVKFIQSDWYENLKGMKFDIIVSNPPYIDSNDNDIDAEVKAYEPASALFAEDNGLADIEIILSQAESFLMPKGSLYIEHGYAQSASVQTMFKKYGFASIETIRDLGGKDRCSKAKKSFGEGW